MNVALLTHKSVGTFREVYARYEAPSHLLQPEDFASDYEQRIEVKERAFKLMQQVMEHYIARDEQEKALAKLEEMRQEFPKHPLRGANGREAG